MKSSAIPLLLIPMLVGSTLALVGCNSSSGEVGVSAPPYVGAQDPGVRGGPAGAGTPLAGLTQTELAFFQAGLDEFQDEDDVEEGLGPTMNLDSCGGCHLQPAFGGTSPSVNPQFAFATRDGAGDRVPPFITQNGPVREARFVKNPDGTPDGGVHALFTLTGRPDADGCVLAQPDFATQQATYNVIFRIPTPVFGAGLIEQIPDSVILTNKSSYASQKVALGIGGRANMVTSGNTISGQANKNGNDGTIARFGWKAQNKSLLLFSGEAYNVEMGITNDLFQTEREENAACNSYATTPNDATMTNTLSAIEQFAVFMRFLGPPIPSIFSPGGSKSIWAGSQTFNNIGCNQCHTPALTTGNSTVPALRNKTVRLYSDLLLHDMGPGLADRISQGQAGAREFRSAPLWGLGQRIFFLHDGRTTDLIVAIQQHQSGSTQNGDASEANAVTSNFNNLSDTAKQDLLNFLRSL